jgi:2-phosphosulfolactate phosphatase
VVLCAGWNDTPSLEDSLLSGALALKMNQQYQTKIADDTALMCANLYTQAENNLTNYLKKSGHYTRLQQHGSDDDLVFCTTKNIAPAVPILINNEFIPIPTPQ